NLLGYDNAEQLMAGGPDIAEQIFCGGRNEIEQINHQLMNDGSVQGYETRFRSRDGREHGVVINLFLNTDEPGLIEGFVANISERKKAQRRMLQLTLELEQRVTERTAELHDSNQHLQQQIRQRGQVEQALREARDAAEAANR